jgi:hypothetical protein
MNAMPMPAAAAAAVPKHGAAGRQRDGEADDGADQHHALDPEIEDARFLRHQLAGGGQPLAGRGR